MADRLATNAEIRAKEVRLIGPEGKQVGVVPLKIAIEAAEAMELDLVEVSPQAQPPVAKVMDYGKHIYDTERAEREQRKAQRATGQKAIRLRPKIDDHDFETKARMARKFLEGGHSVRVQVMFRRRELRRPEMGIALLDRLAEELADTAQVDARHPMEGRFATMVLSPRKSEAKKA
jgi:translation initiation factor IF-3